MRKACLFIIPFSLLSLFSCQQDELFALSITDNFNLLYEPLQSNYLSNSQVVIKLKDENRAGALLNGEEVTFTDMGDYLSYTFIMPYKDVDLKITKAGLFADDCGIGNHVFDEGRESGNFLVYRCLNCGYETRDEKEVNNSYVFDILIREDSEVIYSYLTSSKLQLQVGIDYTLQVTFPLKEYNDEIFEEIEIEDTSLDITYGHSSSSTRAVSYSLQAKSLLPSSQLNLNIKGKEYVIDYEVIDYDFSNFEKVDIDDLNNFKEFKDTLDSLTYYEYDPSSYKGVDDIYKLTSDGLGEYRYDFPMDEKGAYQYNLDYLEVLHDSVYYPAYFPMVNKNPISTRQMDMTIDNLNAVISNAPKSIIPDYSISYGVIDPCCTNPQDPISYFGFICFAKDYVSYYDRVNERLDRYLSDTTLILMNNYPDKFYSYQVGDINILVAKTYNGLEAYFEKGEYIYNITGGLDS